MGLFLVMLFGACSSVILGRALGTSLDACPYEHPTDESNLDAELGFRNTTSVIISEADRVSRWWFASDGSAYIESYEREWGKDEVVKCLSKYDEKGNFLFKKCTAVDDPRRETFDQ